MVRQLACQVLGTHQVQPLSRAHSGPQLVRVWGQLMHFLWVDNKEPLIEPQRCGHTTGIWLQANGITCRIDLHQHLLLGPAILLS